MRQHTQETSSIYIGFNSRTPGGVRQISKDSPVLLLLFQFTHPGRGATTAPTTCATSPSVSIHAPREGCDTICATIYKEIISFNSRTPGGVRHPRATNAHQNRQVSIHAPREGCDVRALTPTDEEVKFQFTHPGRGATSSEGLRVGRCRVSIHAPREGCD